MTNIIIRNNDRLNGLVSNARELCEENGIFEGINQLGISGGKDSTALYLLAYELGVPDVIPTFCDTDNEHESTVLHAQSMHEGLDGATPVRTIKSHTDLEEAFEKKRKLVREKWSVPYKIRNGKEKGKFIPPMTQEQIESACEVLKPSGNRFLDMCLIQRSFPSGMRQYCTHQMKIIPVFEEILKPLLDSQDKEIFSWTGARRDESKKRSDAKLIEEDQRDAAGFLYRFNPIAEWTADDVFAMHKRHNKEPNPLYKQGMGRVGCMPCIYASKSEIKQIAMRFPEHFDRIEEWEEKVNKVTRWGIYSGNTTGFIYKNIKKESTIRNVVEWSLTDRQGNKDMFMDEESKSCSSKYGLCE